MYLVDKDTGITKLLCSVNCPNKEIAEMVYRLDPDGPGYCLIEHTNRALQLQFVRHKRGKIETHSNLSILWDRINITIAPTLVWSIVDESRCPRPPATTADVRLPCLDPLVMSASAIEAMKAIPTFTTAAYLKMGIIQYHKRRTVPDTVGILLSRFLLA